MQRILLEKIIEKVQVEKCPIHNQIASFEIHENDGIIIKKFCCPDFYTDITKNIKDEMDSGLYC